MLSGGALLIDTPGLRLPRMASAAGVEDAFADVVAAAARCRFNDCAHVGEPGCGVRAAIESGELDPARYESYVKLQRELEALEMRRNVLLRKERVREFKIRNRAMRKNRR